MNRNILLNTTLLLLLILSPFSLKAEVYSGSCGASLTWTLNTETQELKIEGSGAMSAYRSYSNVPWYQYRQSISTVTLSSELTSISTYAFYYCANLTTVEIPESVTTIGNSAFSGCSSLASINIPESVTTIGWSAFAYCKGLKDANIPTAVTRIEDSTFNGCSSLASINIPESVTTIGPSAFKGCSSLQSANIPEAVTRIENYTFQGCSSLASIDIPENVTFIGNCAFSGCSNITSVQIPEAVTSIENETFRGCSGLTSVTIPKNVTQINQLAFSGCTGLKSIDIPSSVKSIGNWAFQYCISLPSITLPSVTQIGQFAFIDCTSLTSVDLPNTLTSVGNRPFYGCTSLTDPVYTSEFFIYLPAAYQGEYSIPEGIKTICDGAFRQHAGITSVVIPNTTTHIGLEAFYDCEKLVSVTFGNSVSTIGKSAFMSCEKLASVEIPDAVTTIGESAFSGCYRMTSLKLGKSLNSIERAAFASCTGLTALDLPEKVTTLGYRAFAGCSNLSTLSVPNSLVNIDASFADCYGLTTIKWDVNIANSGFNMYSTGKIQEVIYGDNVTIVHSLFSDCKKLQKVTLGKNVSELRAQAFQNADLKEFHITGNNAPECYEGVFLNVDLSQATLYVPLENKEYYETASPWMEFGEIIPVAAHEDALSALAAVYGEYKDMTFVTGTGVGEYNVDKVNDFSTALSAAQSILNDDGNYSVDDLLNALETLKKTYKSVLESVGKGIDLNDGTNFSNVEPYNYALITYTRNFTNTNWNALYVPFAMNYADWADDFEVARLNDVHQFDDDEDGEVDRTVLELIKLKNGSVTEPNTPYMIKAKEVGEKTITLTNATLYATEENSFDVTSWYTRFTFTGTYSTVTDMATKGHYALADGALVQATSDAATLGAFRWYLDITDRNGSPSLGKARKVFLSFDDGETTEISVVDADAKTTTSIYSIGGMNMGKDKSALPKGLYISNGKKFLVK